MEIVISCLRGLEDVCILEIKELINKKAVKLLDGRVKVECTDANLEKLSNFLRSGLRITSFLGNTKFKSIDDMAKESLKYIKDYKAPILVRCSRFGEHDFKSGDVEKTVGEVLYKKGLSVNLDNPKTTIIVDIINNDCILGNLIIDNLNKREYRIRSTGQSINATICYSLVRFSGWKKDKTILDPFSKDCTIAIEATSFAYNLPLKFKKAIESKEQNIFSFDSLLANVNNSETNAKLAGVNKAIRFARYDIEWLDTKFGKGELGYIVTVFPNLSADRKKDMEKLAKDLFYQAEFILSKRGKMVILSQTDLKGYMGKFKLKEERKVFSGNVEYTVYIATK